jgi:predicted ATPase
MLTKIRVKNFKSLKDVSLSLGQRNVLVGPNMTGKSNLIDLFRFISHMTFAPSGSWALTNAVAIRGGFGELLWKGGEEQAILIELTGEEFTGETERCWEYSVLIQGDIQGNFQVVTENLRVQDPRTMGAELIETKGFEKYFRNADGRQLSSMNTPRRSMLEFEIPDWEGNFMRSLIASWRFYDLVPPVMRNPNPAAAALFLSEHGENLSQWLLTLQTRHSKSFERVQSVLRDALPQVSDLFTSPTQQSTVVLGSREKYLRRPVTLAQMSAGELAFIAYLSLIFGPAELTGGLYCVEDLENHLHPALIETLLQVLRQAQEEWEEKHQAAQIVMTTHSPLVVDKMKVDEVVFVEKREGATVCSRPGDKANLHKLLQDGEVGLGDIVYSGALADASR